MSENTSKNEWETLERYCHVVGKNTTVLRQRGQKDKSFNCSNYEFCQKNGGCSNEMCNNRQKRDV